MNNLTGAQNTRLDDYRARLAAGETLTPNQLDDCERLLDARDTIGSLSIEAGRGPGETVRRIDGKRIYPRARPRFR